ncbi:1-aminocyclopropane-1-carboxylate deaminase/D-cysteine desulfhydrase [Adlercreutzia sp. ZJ141]|uniref:1-aminocyclopropane-1-carboxylate deaminase/D-cysteine desulfhydrase n=1 Tax=Adlercreutzia sp. ZJ141 TaxID=2709406 RepID=UPI0013EB4BC8|nr:pyridoxal-phosphate dependent enzyme [Adlercreutzia sp. ZJ141]
MNISSLVDSQCLIHPIVDTSHSGNNLFVLRDDLLPFGFGGNKVRIALEFVDDLRALGKNALVAYGSSTSNMCRVIANICRSYGIPCTVVLSQSDEANGDCNNKRLMNLFGARTITCTPDAIAPAVETALTRYQSEGFDPYYIFGNTLGQGNEHVAARAYAKTYELISAYAQANGFSFDRIFCASGTQATQSGLICGHIITGDSCKVQGIMISSRSEERARKAIQEAAVPFLKERGISEAESLVNSNTRLITDKRRGGYGLYDHAVLQCAMEQLTVNGFPLDPVYTGKAFLGMQEYLVEEGVSGENILFVHTGGEPIFYDHLQAGSFELAPQGTIEVA